MFFSASKSIVDDVKAHQTPKLKQKIYTDNLKYIYLGKDSFGKNHYKPTQKMLKESYNLLKELKSFPSTEIHITTCID